MAVIYDEAGGQRVREIVREEERVLVPFLSLMEVQYKLLQQRPEVADEALAMLQDWRMTTVESNAEWREVAAAVKARGKLSLADAWVASLALIEDALLVHKDPEFDAVPDLQHERLPYAGRRR